MILHKNQAGQLEWHKKGWGGELWIENIPEYCGKILKMEGGKKTSLHFHSKKVETMYLQSGRIDIDMIDPETGKKYTVDLHPGDALKILPGHPHQIVALKDSELFEFSTQHFEDDSYRISKGD